MLEQDMTDKEFEPYFAKAQEVSQFFREIGPKYDVEDTFAYPSIEVFKKSGLGALPVPREFGGPGGNILHISKVVSELSKGDSAITLAYNMHYIMLGIAGNLMTAEQNKYWMGRVVDGELIFGPFSEQRAGFSGLADMKAIPQSGGGWKLYGKKTWGTLCEAASIITTNATETDADGNIPEGFNERVAAEKLFIGDFTVDENGVGDGLRIEKTWNALGMHATGTQTIVFDGYFVPEEGFVSHWRSGAFGTLEWASLMFASIYLGMQYRLLEETTAALAKKHLGATFGAIVAADTEVKSVGHIVDGIGDFASRVEFSRRVLYRTCQELIEGKDKDWPTELRFPYLGLAKTFVADNVMHMSRHAMSMVGGSSFRKGTIFERLYRDSAASMFQPLNADQTRTYVGQYLLEQAAAK
ncbi:acyl-CoA/acyl-ACP dehydrogenase [Mycobacteroides abscessus]|uniref:acyl-CoA dehydrogenase family protein n=1 Tax=Mycobacteroides abscessus TaxID=36809 RepID=UPI00078B6CED|nr:acyl-CoA dehydrogenase family protein [Mycobacteroides abscessus]AMU72809.1 acyl-CoA dehydrogenase [Mycobacteroides abscessus]MDM2014631.1 acyl-CoA/acyl-ACP dehydrogenase [Mycobacteroides abscessus]MDM2020272.1 acyl-CoA/acyl-ACP dehydrogenase [Mycobacteroides abscessus]MDM2023919.1 acyl-CoA/acyl-ACP dehydrogenase [Mycobacteroides abscessus]MDM2028810.1 acyl-CoA/acyl-ACP dehydrogenase [Mycobacteroides abscessus]